jgi:hypothetical protein
MLSKITKGKEDEKIEQNLSPEFFINFASCTMTAVMLTFS